MKLKDFILLMFAMPCFVACDAYKYTTTVTIKSPVQGEVVDIKVSGQNGSRELSNKQLPYELGVAYADLPLRVSVSSTQNQYDDLIIRGKYRRQAFDGENAWMAPVFSIVYTPLFYLMLKATNESKDISGGTKVLLYSLGGIGMAAAASILVGDLVSINTIEHRNYTLQSKFPIQNVGLPVLISSASVSNTDKRKAKIDKGDMFDFYINVENKTSSTLNNEEFSFSFPDDIIVVVGKKGHLSVEEIEKKSTKCIHYVISVPVSYSNEDIPIVFSRKTSSGEWKDIQQLKVGIGQNSDIVAIQPIKTERENILVEENTYTEFNKHFSAGVKKFNEEKFNDAIYLFKLATTYQQDAHAYYNIALSYFNKRRFDDALEYIHKCKSVCSDDELISKANSLASDINAIKEHRQQRVENAVGALLSTGATIMSNSYMPLSSPQTSTIVPPPTPQQAMQQVEFETKQRYNQFIQAGNRKPDGSLYTIDEFKVMEAQAWYESQREIPNTQGETADEYSKRKQKEYQERRENDKERIEKMIGQHGYVQCTHCSTPGNGRCKTCNGKGLIPKGLGLSGYMECPNCELVNGKRSGSCRYCHGTGKIYK